MGVTKNYDRPKSPSINSTGIAITVKADEGSGAAPADLAGDDGKLYVEFEGDADESGGTLLENLFRLDAVEVTIDQTTGRINLVGTIVPVLGDGTDAPTTHAINIVHPQTMDAWQADAGRAQQA